MAMVARQNIFSTSEAAFAVDKAGQIVVWNESAEKTFGYLETETLGQQCWELLSGRDVFNNQSCCEGCPIRGAAFKHEPINPFQVDFKTAAQKRKRFTVSTLIICNHPEEEIFVHLCRPESGISSGTFTKDDTIRPTHKKLRKSLTARETEVLTLLHKGMTIQQIATTLSVTPSTVRNHTQHVLSKLRVHSRYEAAALGRKLGLI